MTEPGSDAPTPPPPIAESPHPKRRFGWKFKAAVAGVLLLPVVVVGLWIFSSFAWSYSEGERAGYVQKFSKKGWLCKTWEGELAMVAVPGSNPEKFFFTVRDDAVAQHVNQTMGQRVSLSYQQHKGLPTTCFGDTEYFVNSVRPIP